MVAKNTSEMVKVQFYDDTLEAIEEAGKVLVSLKRCCDNLGLAYDTQLRKLRGRAWATVTQRVIVAEDGKQREMVVCDLDTLPMWLATIDSRRVKESVRGKLDRYQKEAARVLADHFFHRNQPPQITTDGLRELIREVMSEMRPALTHTGPSHPGPFWTVAGRLEEMKPDWKTTRTQRVQIRRIAKSMVATLLNEHLDYYNRDLAFYSHQVHLLDRAIETVERQAKADESKEGWGLFVGVIPPGGQMPIPVTR